MKKLVKKIIVKKQLEVLTGLHIGNSADSVEIGGVDKPVVRRSIDNVPYIPGSSLKGKIRSLLEQTTGAAEVGDNDHINDVFGFEKKNKPSKIIVRDAIMSVETVEKLKNSDYTDMPYTEIKYENSISRITGTASNPRQIERIPAGSKFDVEFIINVWENENNETDEQKSIQMLNNGIKILENDYLGGNGTRGYGKVKFNDISEKEEDLTKYIKNE